MWTGKACGYSSTVEHGERTVTQGGSAAGSCVLHQEILLSGPDIIYTVPDMKGEMTIWVNSVKSKERKHYMMMFLREAYAIFKVVHPEVQVGFSKFSECRLQNVMLFHDSPRDQCRCKIHDNIILRLHK